MTNNNNKTFKYLRFCSSNVVNQEQLQKLCYKYQLLVQLGVNNITPLMYNYVEMCRKTSKYLDYAKYYIGFLEFSIFFKTLLSHKTSLKWMVVSLLKPESVEFVQDFALRNKMYYSIGEWQSGSLTNFIKSGRVVWLESEINRMNKTFLPEMPDLIVLFQMEGSDKVLDEARKCGIPVVSISGVNTDPRVTVSLPGDGSSPMITYTYCKLLELFITKYNNQNSLNDLNNELEKLVDSKFNNSLFQNIVLDTKNKNLNPIIKKSFQSNNNYYCRELKNVLRSDEILLKKNDTTEKVFKFSDVKKINKK